MTQSEFDKLLENSKVLQQAITEVVVATGDAIAIVTNTMSDLSDPRLVYKHLAAEIEASRSPHPHLLREKLLSRSLSLLAIRAKDFSVPDGHKH